MNSFEAGTAGILLRENRELTLSESGSDPASAD